MKKLLAIVLTALLILSMGTVAFAAEGDLPTYTDQETVTVTKFYKLIGAGSSPAETFTLTPIGAGSVVTGEAETAPALGEIVGAAFAAGAATETGAEGSITITLPEYTSVGVYKYILREAAGTNAGVAYFGSDIRLFVNVIHDEATGQLRIAGVHTEGEGQTEKTGSFDNTYSAGTLNITKTVTGNLGDQNKFFEFTVTLIGDDGLTYASPFTVSGGSHESNPGTIALGAETTFYLKHGETVSIANLPYGVTYTVTEISASADGYTTTSDGAEGTIGAAVQTAAFTNDKESEIDTGIFLDSLPYVIILAVVALACAAMLLKRHRSER